MLDFYKTGGGRKLFDSTLPAIGRQLKRVADQLERANNLKEKELGIKKDGAPHQMADEDDAEDDAEALSFTMIRVAK